MRYSCASLTGLEWAGEWSREASRGEARPTDGQSLLGEMNTRKATKYKEVAINCPCEACRFNYSQSIARHKHMI